MKLFITLESPHHWVLLDTRGEVVDQGHADELSDIRKPRQVVEVIGVSGGQAITVRSAMVPGKRRATVEAALPYALEESLSEDVDSLHFTVLQWQPGEEVVTAIVSREQLKKWIQQFSQVGLDLDTIVPGYLLLPLHAENSYTVSRLADQSINVRTGALSGFNMDQSFFDYWLDSEDLSGVTLSFTDIEHARSSGQLLADLAKDSTEIKHWDIGNRLADWLGADGRQSAVTEISLLHGDFLPAHKNKNYRPLKIAAVCALFAFGLHTLSMWQETAQLKEQEANAKRQTKALFNQRFPGEPWLGRPQVQVNALLDAGTQSSGNSNFQPLLQAMTTVSQKYRASIEEINYRDNALIVLCNVESLAVLDSIRAALQDNLGVRAELLSSGARDNQVSGRFRLEKDV